MERIVKLMTKYELNTSFVSLKGIDKYYGKTAVIRKSSIYFQSKIAND